MRMTDTQLLILSAAGDAKKGTTLANIADKVSVANPKRACESLVKRGLLKAAEIKLINGIGKAAGYALTKAGEEALGYPDASDEPEAKTEAKAKPAAAKTAPKEGTRVRGIFDILTRKGGATNAECKAADLGDVSLKHHATRFADRFGLTVRRAKEGRGERVSLV